MLRVFQPWNTNTGKRMVKRPKIYLSDSGLFHTLMNIEDFDQLSAHPKLGNSFDGFALECICKKIKKMIMIIIFTVFMPDQRLIYFGSKKEKTRARNLNIRMRRALQNP
jgi:predicted AAA+ superfamily ATPase